MKTLLKVLINNLVIGISIFFSIQSLGQTPEGLRVQNLTHKGTGCPQGSVAITVAPDQSAISFIFSEYGLEVPPQIQGLKTCSLRFLMTPPSGYQLKVVSIDYRGFSNLGAGAKARFNSEVLQEFQFRPRRISMTNNDFLGPVNDNITIESQASGAWSTCGGGASHIIISTAVQVINQSNEPALFTIDSADLGLAAGATFNLAWQKCASGGRWR